MNGNRNLVANSVSSVSSFLAIKERHAPMARRMHKNSPGENVSMKHPVLEAIVERQKNGSVPGRRDDDFKIALAIEGGAMRGVVSAGMLAGLEYLGLLPTFDVIYGTSAGAINGAYFVAGQAAYGTSIYYEDLNNAQFASPLRWLAGERPVSLEFLFEHVMISQKPLNWRRVLDSHIELVPMAASVSQARSIPLRGAHSRYSLFLRLKASAGIPFLAGPPLCVEGEPCLDGGLFASVPFRQAMEEGCTHVLALLTRPRAVPLRKTSAMNRLIISRKLARYNPLLGSAFLDRASQYAREMNWLRARTSSPDRAPYVYAVNPPDSVPMIRRFETRPDRLVFAARTGMSAMLRAFGRLDSLCTESVLPYPQSRGRLRELAVNQRILQRGLGA